MIEREEVLHVTERGGGTNICDGQGGSASLRKTWEQARALDTRSMST